MPGDYYLGLLVTAPNDSGGGWVEVSDPDYARQIVTFTAADNGIYNDALIEFPVSVAGYSSEVVSVGVFTAASGGQLRRWTRVADTDPVLIPAGDHYSIPAGLLRINNLASW